jgi:signal peptide peptidase SppA
MLKYGHILNYFYSNAWAMRPDKLLAIEAFLADKACGVDISAEDVQAIVQAATAGRPQKVVGNVAVLPIMGVISHRAGMMQDLSEPQGASAEKISRQLDALIEDTSVGAILLDMNSPGGTVPGVMELADKIYNARGVKKIVAVANAQVASAAYWIGSQAEEFVVVPSGEVGSIGVFMVHQDLSERFKMAGIQPTLIKAGKYKVEGNPYVPLDEEARAAFQASVDQYYDAFVKAVARGRGVNTSAVRNGFGEGRMVMAQEAVKLGMADRVATMDDTLKRLGAAPGSGKVMQAEAEAPEIQAEEIAETTPEPNDLLKMQQDLFGFM